MSNIHTPPAIRTSNNTDLPVQPYLCRVKSARVKPSADPAKVGYKSIEVNYEIIAPDMVDDPHRPGNQVRAAGRQASFYIPVFAGMKNYESAFEFLGKLELLDPTGSFDEDTVVAQFNRGDVFFEAIVLCEQDKITRMENGKRVDVINPATGQPFIRGYRIALMNAEYIIGRRMPPTGFETPTY